MKINFVSSKDDSDEIRKIHTKSHNVEIMMGSETDETIEELFESLLQNYQNNLEKLMKGSEFTFDSVDLLYYHLHQTSLKSIRSSYIDSPRWLKNKKATINAKNNGGSCFQYATIAALNRKQIKNHLEKISNLKPFIDQYDCKGMNFPPKQEKNLQKFESNNKSIALNILFVSYNTEEIARAYISKYNPKRKNQVILLMITDGKKWLNLAVKSLSALLGEITLTHNGDFYSLSFFNSYSTKNKLKKHERVCYDQDCCYVEMPNDNNKILKYN